MKILAVIESRKGNGGGGVVSSRNVSFLSRLSMEMENSELHVFTSGEDESFWNRMSIRVFGVSIGTLLDLARMTKKTSKEEAIFWFDRSTFGILNLFIRAINRKAKIYTFFHNDEVMYFGSMYKYLRKSSVHLLFLVRVKQILSIKLSHKLFFISDSEMNSLGKSGSAYLFPPCWKDEKNMAEIQKPSFVLIVGSNFYANAHGFSWYCENIAQKISGETVFVGRGIDQIVGSSKRVKVFSDVEDILEFYRNAGLVAVPIFIGAGLKVKLAEALHYGLKVVATEEAVLGLANKEKYIESGQLIVSSENQFAEKIERALESPYRRFLLNDFSESYCFEKFRRDFFSA